ncbi:hypothetical protein HSX11_20815 [Oxalobacteraceae bacterium]|nr:hypothetical protein [Oxalobacteraceae bacterium]
MKKLMSLMLVLLLAACASKAPSLPADNLISPNFRLPQVASLIVLLPAEVESAELQPGAAMLMKSLHQSLTAAGYRVAALDQGSHDAIWTQEVEEVGGIYDQRTGALRSRELTVVLGRLVQRVSAETHAAVVMRPRLVLRGAEISGMSAVWDGQQRHVRTFGAGGDTVTSRGSTLGLSVALDIFASSGEWLMHTHGGALLPYIVNVQTGKNDVRPDLFANEQEIADGVAIALMPFVKI